MYEATQSTKRLTASGSAGASSSLSATGFSFAGSTPSVPGPQTTPRISRVPSGTTTKSPGWSASPSGTK